MQNRQFVIDVCSVVGSNIGYVLELWSAHCNLLLAPRVIIAGEADTNIILVWQSPFRNLEV